MGQKQQRMLNTDFQVYSEVKPTQIYYLQMLIDQLSYVIPPPQTYNNRIFQLLLENPQFNKSYRITLTKQIPEDFTELNDFVQIYLLESTEEKLKKNVLIFTGELKHGKRHNFGVEYDVYGNIIYQGMFKHNKYHGWGITKQYKGQWENGKKSGYGIYQCNRDQKKPIKYQGLWKQDRFHGMGAKNISIDRLEEFLSPEFKDKDAKLANKYVGQWFQGSKFGCGKTIQYHKLGPSLTQYIYEGQFANNKFHGKGKLIQGNKTYHGTFQQGKFIQK